jgi:nitrogenase-stabilizing/protective protein
MIPLPAELVHLETAEEFLDHFAIPYDAERVRVARLHILQRFHDYLATSEPESDDGRAVTAQIRGLLARAYDDFVRSDPLTERVFRVLKDNDPATAPVRPPATFVPIADVLGVRRDPD